MILRILLLAGLLLLGAAIAFLLQRRRPEPPTAPTYRVPAQIDRADFAESSKPILVVLFSSLSCDTCPKAWKVLETIENKSVDFQKIDIETDPSLHKRYKIDGVPTTLIIDSQGKVQKSFLGPLVEEEIVNALP